MGYYSQMQLAKGELQIRKELLGKALKAIKEKIKDEDIGCYLEQMQIDDEGCIEFPEYYQKWYDADKLFYFLAPFVEDCKIEFLGEDGAYWGYEIAEGKLYILEITKIYTRMNEVTF